MVLLVLFLIVPAALYFGYGRGRGPAWGLLPAGETAVGEGAYRQARVRTWKPGAAPLAVRAAALSSFFLGQMIVPGALAALGGLVVLAETLRSSQSFPLLVVLVLSAPTGVMVAAHLLAAGSAMLNRADDAAPRARRAARWALLHNGLLVPALALAAAVAPDEAVLVVWPAVYVGLSLAQGLLVLHAARALEAYAARQDDDPAPPEAALDAPR